MKTGILVRSITTIQSDDRELGIDDGSLIVPVGTSGRVLGNSADMIEDGCSLKTGAESCVVVAFDMPDGVSANYDCLPGVDIIEV